MILLTLLFLGLASWGGRALFAEARTRVGEVGQAAVSGLLLVGLAAWLALFSHLPIRACIAGAMAVGFAAAWLRRHSRTGFASSGAHEDRHLMLFAALTVVVLLPAILRATIRMRADAWYHAAIALELGAHGLPAEDPYFAGLPLQYMWFYHCVLVGLRALFAPGPWSAMVLLNGVALFALLVALFELSLELGSDAATARRVAWVAPLGMGTLFWIFLPLRAARALLGRSRGPLDLAHLVLPSTFDVNGTREFLSVFQSHPFFLNKYLVGTAYGLALTLFLFYLTAMLRYLRAPSTRGLVRAGFWLFGLLLLHPVAGAVAALASVASIAALLAGRRGFGARGAALPWFLQLVVVGLLVIPYSRAVSGTRSTTELVPLGLNHATLPALLVGALFALLAAPPIVRRLWREGPGSKRVFVLWIAIVWLVALVVRLPGPNTADKFGFLTYLVLAVPASWWTAERWRGARGAVWLLLLLAPANLIGWSGYWGEPTSPEPTVDRTAANAWIATHTAPQAVVVEKPERLDAPVRAARSIYFGREIYARQFNYPEAEITKRRSLVASIWESDAAFDSLAVTQALAALHRPAYVVVATTADTTAQRRLSGCRGLFRAVWSSSEWVIYTAR
ncbi:MAG: hypothetical protein U0527_11030 [Candidatus Eisenbacteria bacterium]